MILVLKNLVRNYIRSRAGGPALLLKTKIQQQGEPG